MSASLDPQLANDAAYVAEVRELCRLAHHPELATAFIESQWPIDAVADLMVEISIGFHSPFRAGLAIAPFKDLFRGDGGFAGSDL